MPHHHHHHHRHCTPEVIPEAPWYETNWEPDTQWTPVVHSRTPPNFVTVPFYQSSEDPAPEWASNVVLRHGHKHKSFLRRHAHDTVLRHIYGRNPYMTTVSSGGIHFQ